MKFEFVAYHLYLVLPKKGENLPIELSGKDIHRCCKYTCACMYIHVNVHMHVHIVHLHVQNVQCMNMRTCMNEHA